ncbi:MAG: class I SAM-dependent methyltransferase [Vicinamibacterales bacterium]|nr:class I SAM-dependent methyltransferase [Vicinamibacterales bacterium]
MFRRTTNPETHRADSVLPDTSAGAVVRTTVMPKFVSAVARRAMPVVVDLGVAVGPTVEFLSERLDCTIHVQDCFADVEAHARRRAEDPELGLLALASKLLQPLESVDGILCWDLFDYLEVSTGRTLAARLTGLLRPGGALHGLFGTTPDEVGHYTRFVMESDDRLRLQTYPATHRRRAVLATGDIHRMFGKLTVAEFVLLRSHSRETLFRKPPRNR